MLGSLCCWSFKPDRKENLVQEWKAAVDYCLVELSAFRQASTSIQKSYLDGQAVLLPDAAKDLAEIITHAEKPVRNFDDGFANGIEPNKQIDMEASHRSASKEPNHLVAYTVDMAKAMALDCLGDRETAVKIAEPYL